MFDSQHAARGVSAIQHYLIYVMEKFYQSLNYLVIVVRAVEGFKVG